MSALGREKIYSAFYALLEGQLLAPSGPFAYGSRRYRPVGSLGASQYPAFYLTEVGEEYDRSVLYVPAKVTLFAHVTIQTANGLDPANITATQVNDLADAVESAVTSAALPSAQSTLGGLVQDAWVNGRQAQVIGSSSAKYSEQVVGIEIILPRIR